MGIEQTAERFIRIFRGLDRAYGTYKLTGKTSSKGKAEGQAMTRQDSWGVKEVTAHLKGETGIGIVPIMGDDMCTWGSIDIDEYRDFDPAHISRVLHERKSPLVACRSKSGGAHLFLFTTEPVPASEMRRALGILCDNLDFQGSEIFPKQSTIDDGDVGNWLNMPYFDAERTVRYGMQNGKPIYDVNEFLDYCEAKALTPDAISAIKVEADPDAPFPDGPPCLQALAKKGVPEGGRNETLFNMGVYAHLVRPDGDWQELLNEYNNKYMSEPLPYNEVATIEKTLSKKDYFYRCEVSPICNYCNKSICKQRQFGIGGGEPTDPGIMIDALDKIITDPPLWIVTINGVRIQLQTEELMSQALLGKRCMEKLNELPHKIGNKAWTNLIQGLLKKVNIIEAPDDASPAGQLMYHLEQFCTTRAQARVREEILMGKPWTEEGRTLFRGVDFKKYLHQQQFRTLKDNQIFGVLQERTSITNRQFKAKGKNVRCWSVPEFVTQDGDHDPARLPETAF